MKRCFLAAALCACATANAQPNERLQDRWNLADLYASEDAWKADSQKVEAMLAPTKECRGQLGVSARRFRECFELRSDIVRGYYGLAVYANELQAQDTGHAPSLALRQASPVLGAKLV